MLFFFFFFNRFNSHVFYNSSSSSCLLVLIVWVQPQLLRCHNGAELDSCCRHTLPSSGRQHGDGSKSSSSVSGGCSLQMVVACFYRWWSYQLPTCGLAYRVLCAVVMWDAMDALVQEALELLSADIV